MGMRIKWNRRRRRSYKKSLLKAVAVTRWLQCRGGQESMVNLFRMLHFTHAAVHSVCFTASFYFCRKTFLHP